MIVSHGFGGAAVDGIKHPPLDILVDQIDRQGFVLLFSSDGGKATWGNDAALSAVKQAYHAALPHFRHDGKVYTLGVSMGGLPASLTALRKTLGVQIRATALVAGRVNLLNAVHTSRSRAASVALAYPGKKFTAHDPVNHFHALPVKRTPLLAVVSPDDTIVTANENGLKLAHLVKSAGGPVEVLTVRGQHLTHGYINPDVGRQIGLFFKRHP